VGNAVIPNVVQASYPEQPVYTAELQTATVMTLDGGALNLRSSPNESGINRIGRAPSGAIVEVLESRSDWTKERYDGMTAWAQTKYLSMNASNMPNVQENQTSNTLPANYQIAGKGITITISEDVARQIYTELDSALFG
jgi:uncharacterized protein YraI